MNAWVESGRTDSFANLHANDVVVRTSSQTNTLVLGNGLNPYCNAALYITSNCIGINRQPDTTSALAAHMVLDIAGMVACRSGMTWCDPSTACHAAETGSNGTRASVAGIVLNDGTLDTLRMDRTGGVTSTGTVSALAGVFGSCVVNGPIQCVGQVTAQDGAFQSLHVAAEMRCSGAVFGKCEVLGQALFDQGIRMSTGPGVESCITYDGPSDVMSVGNMATFGQEGMTVNGTVVSKGQMFSAGYKVLSDARLKRDIVPSERETDLQQLLQVDVRRYRLADDLVRAPHIGVLAHELACIMPDAVSLVEGYMAVDTNHILFRLVSAVQSLSARLATLEASSASASAMTSPSAVAPQLATR